VKVSLSQVAAKMLPTKTSETSSHVAGMFSAALADAWLVDDKEPEKADGLGVSHAHKEDKVKPHPKDDRKSSTEILPTAKPVEDLRVPPMMVNTGAVQAPKPELREKAAPVPTTEATRREKAGHVSSVAVAAGYIDRHYTPPTQAPITLAKNLRFGEELGGQGHVETAPAEKLNSREPQPDKLEQINHNASPAGQMKDEAIAAVPARMPAVQSSTSEPAMEIAAAIRAQADLPVAGVPPAKETRGTRPARQAEPAFSSVGNTSQKSPALQSHSTTEQIMHAINNPSESNPISAAVKDSARQDLPHGEQKAAAQKQAEQTPSAASPGADAGSHSSHHAKSESAAGATNFQNHAEVMPAKMADRSEVPAPAQVLHAAGEHGIVREPSDKVFSPGAATVAHTSPGTAHLNTEEVTTTPGYAFHAARLVERLGQSELRLGVHAGELGKVDIRTSLGRTQFTAEISVERGELGRALTAELPSLHTRLAEQHLPAANITVQDYSAGASADQQGSQHNRTFPPMNVTSGGTEGDTALFAPMIDAMEPTTRLDIHM